MRFSLAGVVTNEATAAATRGVIRAEPPWRVGLAAPPCAWKLP